MPTIVITDTCCLIVLDNIGALPLLPIAYAHIVVTPVIAKEFQKALPEWITVMPVTDTATADTYRQLVDAGEASAIALAQELTDVLLILDDRKGRRLAKQLHLPFTGTVGMLGVMRERGHIRSLRPYFEAIKETDFRYDHALLDQILAQFGD